MSLEHTIAAMPLVARGDAFCTTYSRNRTGCIVSVSGITGDVLCRFPGPYCDCLMGREDMSEDDARTFGWDGSGEPDYDEDDGQ